MPAHRRLQHSRALRVRTIFAFALLSVGVLAAALSFPGVFSDRAPEQLAAVMMTLGSLLTGLLAAFAVGLNHSTGEAVKEAVRAQASMT